MSYYLSLSRQLRQSYAMNNVKLSTLLFIRYLDELMGGDLVSALAFQINYHLYVNDRNAAILRAIMIFNHSTEGANWIVEMRGKVTSWRCRPSWNVS